jgi:hypothetical protein
MGGSPVTVSGGVINISNVTGNIIITAVAEEIAAAEPVTENITLLKDTSLVLDGTDRANTVGYCATVAIDVSNLPKPCTIHLTGARWTNGSASDSSYIRTYIEDTSGNKLIGNYTYPTVMPSGVTMTRNNDTDVDVTVTVTSDNIGKLRFAGYWAWSHIEENLNGTVMVAKATLTYTPNGAATTYTVTNNLTNCTINNSAKSVVEGGSYSAVISANDGFELKSVSVTMGGSAVSVSGGVINIASVTGDIVITAVAEEKAVEVEPTNFFDVSQGFAGRLSSSGADRTDSPASFVTNYVPVQAGDTIKISGCTVAFKMGSTYAYMTGYNSGKTNVYTDSSRTSNNYWTFDTITSTEAQITVLDSNIAYFRFGCADPTFYNTALTANSNPVVDTSAIVINIKRNGEWL